jgi:uncharacterized glyoxalase superfamily protein PhnB
MALRTEHVWPCLGYRDAPAAVDFLKAAFGFEPTLVVPGEDDRVVAHSELLTPWGGGVMVTSAGEGGDDLAGRAGTGSVCVVVDDPDALCARATAAGAEVVRALRDETDYPSRGFIVRDPEGNVWCFGTYAGEQPT